jgi:hypothetical protein
MASRIGGAFLLVLAGALTAGCGAGVNGPVVTGQNPGATPVAVTTTAIPFGGRSNLILNGSFEHGIPPWAPTENSTLFLAGSKTTPFGQTVLAVQVPAVGRRFGAQTAFGFQPVSSRSRFKVRFTVWISGSPNLHSNPVEVKLEGRSATARTTIGTVHTRLRSGWHRVTVEGGVAASADYLGAVVSVQNSIHESGVLELDGVTAFRVGS